MKITILTLFPEMYHDFLTTSIVARAIGNHLVNIEIVDIRDYATGSYRHVDDSPIGGGAGMILKCQPVLDCLDAVTTPGCHKILLAAAGRTYDQARAHEYARMDHLVLLCGHYEGIDARINDHVDEQISIGDYILTGGELASMVIADSVIRLLKGSIKEESATEESYENSLLEYPQYTQPADYKGEKVPPVLLSGNHEKIRIWRLKESLYLTYHQRPDLLEDRIFTEEENRLLKQIKDQEHSEKILTKIRKGMNFRELGGIETKDGRHVRYGTFYRGSGLGYLDQDELAAVRQLGLKVIFDLRSEYERSLAPDPEIPGSEYVHCSAMRFASGADVDFSPKAIEKLATENSLNQETAADRIHRFYTDMLFGSEAYRLLMNDLKQEKTPILIHCTSGKDRTGIAAMLILLLLGADEETAKKDYLKTNIYRRELIDEFKKSKADELAIHPDLADAYQGWTGVLPSTADVIIEAIRSRYGTVNMYFEKEFGITARTRKRIRDHYLE